MGPQHESLRKSPDEQPKFASTEKGRAQLIFRFTGEVEHTCSSPAGMKQPGTQRPGNQTWRGKKALSGHPPSPWHPTLGTIYLLQSLPRHLVAWDLAEDSGGGDRRALRSSPKPSGRGVHSQTRAGASDQDPAAGKTGAAHCPGTAPLLSTSQWRPPGSPSRLISAPSPYRSLAARLHVTKQNPQV